ncbi:MAG: hypothetical protein J0H68_03480 [Sphingobacteriia bacterium]|nr:hypothetical protein [Sphingobacteriia bacterium]
MKAHIEEIEKLVLKEEISDEKINAIKEIIEEHFKKSGYNNESHLFCMGLLRNIFLKLHKFTRKDREIVITSVINFLVDKGFLTNAAFRKAPNEAPQFIHLNALELLFDSILTASLDYKNNEIKSINESKILVTLAATLLPTLSEEDLNQNLVAKYFSKASQHTIARYLNIMKNYGFKIDELEKVLSISPKGNDKSINPSQNFSERTEKVNSPNLSSKNL